MLMQTCLSYFSDEVVFPQNIQVRTGTGYTALLKLQLLQILINILTEPSAVKQNLRQQNMFLLFFFFV